MIPSLLTALLFAISGICGRRSAVGFGPLRGNALRLALAVVVLGAVSLGTGRVEFGTVTVNRLLLSGVVGFGLGDVALFLAYTFLGARLTLLVNLSSAPLFGAALDWALTGTVPGVAQSAAAAVIVAGVAVALRPSKRHPAPPGRRTGRGVAAALVAGLGQGCGAAVTRWAKEAAATEGVLLTAVQEAFVRAVPGLLFSAAMWLVFGRAVDAAESRKPLLQALRGPGGRWLAGAVLAGPVLGVSCFQWALGMAPSAVVLSVTATTPVLVMPLAAWIERDRPGYAAVLGALIAMAGVAWMGWLVPA